ncbi:MAG: LUD domain-containing protein, partial [Flavisolibacter sp.]
MSNNSKNKTHAQLSEVFNRDEARVDWHNETLWWIRQKRDKAAWSLGNEWEPLREQASNIKTHTLSQLSEYLTEFEKNALANGAIVHWAANGEEHNRIVESILEKKKIKELVKSKSMLTEECKLNEYLKEKGFDVIDTDLGER